MEQRDEHDRPETIRDRIGADKLAELLKRVRTEQAQEGNGAA